MDFNTIVSPHDLWKDYNPEEGALHITDIRTATDGFSVTKKLYFDAYTAPGSGAVVRAYGELHYGRAAFAESNGYLPVIVIAADMYGAGVRDCVWQLTGAGYAVFCLDYYGDERSPRCTHYPDELSYARGGDADRYVISDTPQKTCWYVWTAMTRRAVTLLSKLPEVDASRLGIVGLRDGGNVTAAVAAFDERVKCGVIFGNTGWRNYGLLFDDDRESKTFSEERVAYNCCISVESYAQFIKKPMLWVLGTNDTDNDFDRAFDTFARLPQNLKCGLSVSPRADGSIRYEQLGNLRHWLDRFVLYKGIYYETPDLEAYVSASKQYVRCTASDAEQVERVDIYYAYNEEDYRIRNWYRAEEIDVDEGEWIARLSVSGRFVFCFAVVTYRNGVSVSSKQIVGRPKDNGVDCVMPSPGRLIYDSQNGQDCFTVINTGGLFDYRSELEIGTGPFGIPGIQAAVGELTTYKFGDPQFSGFAEDLLSVTYYSAGDTGVLFKVGVPEGGTWRDYTCDLAAEGGEVWQKITLSIGEFKNAQGVSPKSWEDVKRFGIKRERGKTFLISTLLWA